MAQPTTTEHTTVEIEQSESAPTGIAALGIDTPFLIAQVVNFLILFFLLRWVLYRPILDILAKRRTTIEEGLKAAEEAERRAASTQEETAKLLSEARAEASSIVEDAKVAAVAVATKLKEEAAASSEALLQRTRTTLAAEKDAVLTQAEKELTNLVVLATERVLTDQPSTINAQTVSKAIKAAKDTR
jgi:F-type H+-transporting ATPase subunit b